MVHPAQRLRRLQIDGWAQKGQTMKKIKRGQIGALAGACTILSVAACSSVASSSGSSTAAGGATAGSTASGTPTSSITIAGVYGGTTDPFWVTLGCGAQQEAATLGVKYQGFSSTTLDTSAFSQNFSSAQLIKPSGIFVNPSNPNQFITQYKSLMTQGVPVVTINSSTPPNQYKVVGTGTSDSSSMLNQVASLVTASSGSMLVVNGIPGLVPVEVRLNPVVTAIQSAHPGLTSLPTIYSGFDINKATQQVSSDLIANPDLKVIVAADGPDGQAAAAAVEAAHKAGSVTVIALVAQSPQQIGADQVKELVAYIKAHPSGGAVPVNVGTVGVPQALLTKSNIDSPSNSAYLYKASC
jgi:ribose transport system substrate-binding protein